MIKESSKDKRFYIFILIILIVAGLLRFYNYQYRWVTGADQSRDALIGRVILQEKKIPLIGSISSAGQFTFGPWHYYFIAFFTAIYSFSVLTPWIVLTLISIFSVFLMILIGKELKDRNLGILLGMITAFSTAQIAASANLTQHSFVSFWTILSLLWLVKFLNKRKIKFAIFLGLSIGIAINYHWQAVGLLTIPFLLLAFRKFTVKSFISFIIAFTVTFIPYFIFDLTHNWFNLRGIYYYLTVGQHNFYYSYRWLFYLRDFWPSYWAHVIGGEYVVGVLLIGLVSLFSLRSLIYRKMSLPLFIIMLNFLIQIVLVRYQRSPKYFGYLGFFQPYILLFTGYALWEILKKKKLIGLFLMILILSGSSKANLFEYRSRPHDEKTVNLYIKEIEKKFPNEKFAVYDDAYKTVGTSTTLSLFLYAKGKIGDDGLAIGLCSSRCGKYGNLIVDKLVDLRDFTSEQLSKDSWYIVNPNAIYHSTVEFLD